MSERDGRKHPKCQPMGDLHHLSGHYSGTYAGALAGSSRYSFSSTLHHIASNAE